MRMIWYVNELYRKMNKHKRYLYVYIADVDNTSCVTLYINTRYTGKYSYMIVH